MTMDLPEKFIVKYITQSAKEQLRAINMKLKTSGGDLKLLM